MPQWPDVVTFGVELGAGLVVLVNLYELVGNQWGQTGSPRCLVYSIIFHKRAAEVTTTHHIQAHPIMIMSFGDWWNG